MMDHVKECVNPVGIVRLDRVLYAPRADEVVCLVDSRLELLGIDAEALERLDRFELADLPSVARDVAIWVMKAGDLLEQGLGIELRVVPELPRVPFLQNRQDIIAMLKLGVHVAQVEP